MTNAPGGSRSEIYRANESSKAGVNPAGGSRSLDDCPFLPHLQDDRLNAARTLPAAELDLLDKLAERQTRNRLLGIGLQHFQDDGTKIVARRRRGRIGSGNAFAAGAARAAVPPRPQSLDRLALRASDFAIKIFPNTVHVHAALMVMVDWPSSWAIVSGAP